MITKGASMPEGNRPRSSAILRVEDGFCGTTPSVGILWLIPSAGNTVLFTQRSALKDAEPYGDCLTHPIGHYELWERLRGQPFHALKKRGLPIEIKSAEYEFYPRGRVVYEKPLDTFIIYADIRLHLSHVISTIIGTFHLSGHATIVRSDPHYRTR